MNRKIKLASMVSLLSLIAGVAGAAVVTKFDCEALGYTTPLNDCLEANGTPLFCPFHSVEKPMTLCLTKSCRGYPLTEEDLESKASDGKGVREHIEELDSCTTGPVEGGKTYYKVVRCKSTSLYQNNLCDVGCLAERYPYDSHQGNIAGDMRRCDDSTGEHYGYETCNDGWIGGWVKNRTGICELAACDVKNFPYMSNPNAYYNRGITKQCLVGGNPYYRYSSTDSLDNPSDEACGVANEYTLNNAVCQKQCVFSNCSMEEPTRTTLSGIDFEYNNWACKLATEDCRVGDIAIVNGINVGIVTHLPTDSSDLLRIMTSSYSFASSITSGSHNAEGLPLPNKNCSGNELGKYYDKFTLAYMKEKNKTAVEPYEFPGVQKMSTYAPSDCPDGSVCGKGEWYLPSCSELKQIFENRYIVYNITKSSYGSTFINTCVLSSSFYNNERNHSLCFSGSNGVGGITSPHFRYGTYNFYPMLSFHLK